jgi:hypothetical protein
MSTAKAEAVFDDFCAAQGQYLPGRLLADG